MHSKYEVAQAELAFDKLVSDASVHGRKTEYGVTATRNLLGAIHYACEGKRVGKSRARETYIQEFLWAAADEEV